MQVLGKMYDLGLVPVFYNSDIEQAKKIVTAVGNGGCPLVEFTNRGDHAWEVFTQLEEFCRCELPEMILGVGSVVDAPTAALYINCGANFVVGPTLNPEVARVCNRRKIPYSPGCGSASEINSAEELGAEIVKIFPGSQVGGPPFVKALRAPCPWTSIMPTGGVDATRESLSAWFDAGAACVGMGSKLISRDLVEKGDWEGIAEKVAATMAVIKEVRK